MTTATALTAEQLVAAIEELGREMDDPNLTAKDEAEICEAMDLATAQLAAMGLDFDGQPLE
jgi:hypothetical protein